MSIGNIIYILSIALQLTAALLLVNNVSTSRKSIIKEYCNQHTAIAFNETDKSLVDYTSLNATIKSACINKFAYIYLLGGYMISLWNKTPTNKCMAIFFVLLAVFLLSIIPHCVAKRKIKNFGAIRFEEIPMVNGVSVFIVD